MWHWRSQPWGSFAVVRDARSDRQNWLAAFERRRDGIVGPRPAANGQARRLRCDAGRAGSAPPLVQKQRESCRHCCAGVARRPINRRSLQWGGGDTGRSHRTDDETRTSQRRRRAQWKTFRDRGNIQRAREYSELSAGKLARPERFELPIPWFVDRPHSPISL